MSILLNVVLVFGGILLAIGILEFGFGIVAASGINLVFGGILCLVGSTMFRMAATRMKKQKDREEQSTQYCMECDLKTNTRSEMLTHANTTGHRFTSGTKPEKPSANDSIEILKTRYAKGEITKEQFDEMKKRLDELEK